MCRDTGVERRHSAPEATRCAPVGDGDSPPSPLGVVPKCEACRRRGLNRERPMEIAAWSVVVVVGAIVVFGLAVAARDLVQRR